MPVDITTYVLFANSDRICGGNQTGGSGNQTQGGGGGGGPTKTVKVGPGGQLKFEPEEIQIPTGGTVKWVWKSSGHNVHPAEGDWGVEELKGPPFTYSHTFEQAGDHKYWCVPHKSAGMIGTVTVGSSGGSGGGGGGQEEVDPEEMGVPFQSHYVGIAAILAMIVSLCYSFFLLKYAESPHAKGGNN